MKKWLPYIIGLLALCWGFDAFIAKSLRDSKHGEFAKFTKVLEKEIDADILVIGSSRAEMNFNPDKANLVNGHKMYNAGFIGTTLVVAKGILDRRLELNHQINTVVLVLDYVLWQEHKYEILKDSPRFLPYLRHKCFYLPLANAHPEMHFARWLPPYSVTYYNDRYLYSAWRSLTNDPIKVDDGTNLATGFRVMSQVQAPAFNTKLASDTTWISAIELNALDDILKTCKARNIRVMAVAPPVYGNTMDQVDLTKARTALNQRLEQYQLDFYDYTHWHMNDQKELFFDDIHLNEAGASHFMVDFEKDLNGFLQQHSP